MELDEAKALIAVDSVGFHVRGSSGARLHQESCKHSHRNIGVCQGKAIRRGRETSGSEGSEERFRAVRKDCIMFFTLLCALGNEHSL